LSHCQLPGVTKSDPQEIAPPIAEPSDITTDPDDQTRVTELEIAQTLVPDVGTPDSNSSSNESEARSFVINESQSSDANVQDLQQSLLLQGSRDANDPGITIAHRVSLPPRLTNIHGASITVQRKSLPNAWRLIHRDTRTKKCIIS
jgi:hypothetical protein